MAAKGEKTMNNYCSTCLGYIASDPCDGCDGTEENHIYYEPDFVRKDTKPRYIDANVLIELATHEGAYGYVDVHDIHNTPTADVVEVVRCKNCKYRRKWEGEKSYYCGKDNVAILGNLRPNFYCGFGKRRKDNDRRNGN